MFMWVGVRVLYLFLVSLSTQVGEDVQPLPIVGPFAAAIVIGFVWVLVLIDARVCRETTLIANLGVRLSTIQVFAAGVAATLELGVNVLTMMQAS